MIMRKFLTTVFSAAVIMFIPVHVYAHAALHHSDPSAGAVVSPSPPSVRIWFSKSLEPSFSAVHVFDQAGKPVDKGHTAVTGDDAKVLEVELPPLAAGKYKVIWKIVALDGHKAKGDYAFTVK